MYEGRIIRFNKKDKKMDLQLVSAWWKVHKLNCPITLCSGSESKRPATFWSKRYALVRGDEQ